MCSLREIEVLTYSTTGSQAKQLKKQTDSLDRFIQRRFSLDENLAQSARKSSKYYRSTSFTCYINAVISG